MEPQPPAYFHDILSQLTTFNLPFDNQTAIHLLLNGESPVSYLDIVQSTSSILFLQRYCDEFIGL